MKVVSFNSTVGPVGIGVEQVSSVVRKDGDESTITLAGGEKFVVKGTVAAVIAALNA